MKQMLAFLCVFGAATTLHAAKVPVTTCGQVVATRGELTGDLDCSSYDGVSVTVGRGLSMNEFTLTGHPDNTVVACTRSCKISGPGTITGGYHGVESQAGIRRSTRVVGVTVTGNAGLGVTGNKVVLKDAIVTNNGSVNGPTFAHTGGANASNKMSVKSSTIEDNLNFGISASTVRVSRGSSVINNGVNPDCLASAFNTSLGCADLAKRNWKGGPRVSASSTCLTSQRLNEAIGANWGVCLND